MNIWSEITVVIPFRLDSNRFPGKALCKYRGKTLVEHALLNSSRLPARSMVLTAPEKDLEATRAAVDLSVFENLELLPSSADCGSATERMLEIYGQLWGPYFMMMPIDEPALDPAELAAALTNETVSDKVEALTFYCDFYSSDDYLSPLSAKVVADDQGKMLYMSRSVIPVRKDGSTDPGLLKKNVGAVLFPRAFLDRLEEWRGTKTDLDRIEDLEQLRWLELGLTVQCIKIHHIGLGIDVPEQVAILESRVDSGN